MPSLTAPSGECRRNDTARGAAHSRWQRALYRAYLPLATSLRSNRRLHRLLFGYSPCPSSAPLGAYWDWTTLTLRRTLRRRFADGMTLLDVGTGTVGVLVIYAMLRLGCVHAMGVDIVPAVVASARRQAAALGLPAEFTVSDLFGEVAQRYDVVTFNAPYLADPDTAALGLCQTPLHQQRFSGGATGGEVSARFLAELPNHLSSGGVALLGVNHFHIGRPLMAQLIAASNCRTDEIVSGLMGGTVYVLRPGSAD